ncbi:hypothetical protein Lal_00022379 [Lupinus albus]|uniref:Uncharacterized protein n=1 Tax=Lupinus albus TaxID=3870 RepID=A0A6A4NZ03_LUPAL|nr:hypothetical protein Lalb_Chr15g0084661 [Lupinus albus]KAF1894885.1 hypothetical protein Lal_00022379 [Lupinus albus]
MASITVAASTCSSSESTPPFYIDEKWKLSKKERFSSRNHSSTTLLMKDTTQKKCAFARKCARLVKEQRARFYIMRRCVVMLICWNEYSDS